MRTQLKIASLDQVMFANTCFYNSLNRYLIGYVWPMCPRLDRI